jgi:hypothetical protein
MATLNTKISNFINKAQTKIREMAKSLSDKFDYQGYQSDDSKDLLLKLTNTREFIVLLNTSDRGGLSDAEISSTIDFFWKWLELNKIAVVNYPNFQTIIQENVVVPSGNYALQSDLLAEVGNRQTADQALDVRIQVLEGFDPDAIFPPGFFDNQDASNVNVWDDDSRLHTHSNKTTLDNITNGLLTALQALEAHYASIGESSGVHVSSTDRSTWNAKISVTQLSALSSIYAPIAHVQSGSDKHTISQITGLIDVINQLNLDIATMAGEDGADGRAIELQSNGDTIEWRYVGDSVWILLGNFKGDAGDPFTVDFRGPSSARLSSAFDGEDEGFAYLETDTGYLYFRNPAGGPATSSAGWEDPIRFVGDNGWSPVLAVFEVSSSKAVFEIVDWVGGSGIKPVFDPGLSPPDPVRWFIGPAGVTLETSVAVNIRGPQGFGFGPIIGDAGTLAARSAHDDKAAGFIYLQTDVSPQVVYIKNTDTSADWGGPYAWQGTVGSSGPPGSGLGKLVNQAAHGLSVFTAVSFRAGAYEQFNSGSDDIWLGVITAVGSSSLFTFVQAGYVSGLSGLVANSLYFVQNDGTISTVDTGRPVFFAISTTEGYVLSGAGSAVPNLDSVLGVGNDAEGQDILDLGNLTLRSGKVVDVAATGGSDVLNVGTGNADVINIGRVGAVINFLGAAANYTETQHYITDKLITLNKGGSGASGVGSGIEIEEGGVITGYFKTNATRDGFDFKAPAITGVASLSLSALSGNRTYTLQDASGTVYQTGGTDVAVADGGTNLSSYTIGDLIQASGATTLAKLASVATGNVLISGGVATVSSWGKVTSSHIDATVQTAGLSYLLASGGTLTGANIFIMTTVNVVKYRLDTLGTALTTDAFKLSNEAAAAAGLPQISPLFVQEGRAWATGSGGSSKVIKYATYVTGTDGVTNPTATWVLAHSIDGGAYSSHFSVSSGGVVTGAVFVGAFSSNTTGFVNTQSNVANGVTAAFYDATGNIQPTGAGVTNVYSYNTVNSAHSASTTINWIGFRFAGVIGTVNTISGFVHDPNIGGATLGANYAFLSSSGLCGFGTLTPTYAVQIKGTLANQNLFVVQENGGTNAFEIIEAAGVKKIGYFGSAPVAQQVSGADLTNNVTAGGTNDTIDDWTSLTVYATDGAAIRNAIYQLSRKLKQINDGLRLYGKFT